MVLVVATSSKIYLTFGAKIQAREVLTDSWGGVKIQATLLLSYVYASGQSNDNST